MLGILDYFYRLIPANPILLRVVAAAGKRRRDLFIRSGYLGLLVAIVIILSAGGGGDLSDLAKTSATLFQRMSYLQLGLVALLAPVFTAGAITQERDSQTYDILLSTPLTNGQIVLGSLLSRLFFVIALLVSGIPIFAMTQIFGGVAINSIVQSFFIAAATAFVTGALAMAIAVLKVGSRRTIFGFYLFVVVYIVGFFVLDSLPMFKIAGHQVNINTDSKISWFTGLQPFLALRSIMHDPTYTPPMLGDLPEGLRAWPLGWYFTDPAGFYTTLMITLSFVLVTPSIVVLRRMAQSSTNVRGWLLQKVGLSKGDRTRKPRTVWSNPVAWREAKTKGSATRATVLRWSFIGLGAAAAFVLVWMYSSFDNSNVRPDFVAAGSYDPRMNYLTVYGADSSATSLPITPETVITLNGKEKIVGPDALNRRLEVTAVPQTNSEGQKTGWATVSAFDRKRLLSATDARLFLLGLTVVEFAVILLIVTNVAASTVTREKEDGTLDILLSTPITSRYYIWGKLRGLVAFALPLIAVPIASVLVFVVHDLLQMMTDAANFQNWIAVPESLLVLPATLVMTCAFATIVGMQMSLRARKTVVAVMSSVGIVAGLCAVLGFCGFQVLKGSSSDTIGVVIGSFSPFTLLSMQIDPEVATSNMTPVFDAGTRTFVFIFGWIAVGIYVAAVAAMYRSMVKNFDMTIRRQQR